MSSKKSWTRCWVDIARLTRQDPAPYWVRHALSMCAEVSAATPEVAEGELLDLVAAHFSCRSAHRISTRPSGWEVSCSSPRLGAQAEAPHALDYVFATGFSVALVDARGAPVACCPLRQPGLPRVTGALLLGRDWDLPRFERADLELLGVFALALGGTLAGSSPTCSTAEDAVEREETRTSRRSRLDLKSPTAPGDAPVQPLTLDRLFGNFGLRLPDYLQRGE